MIYTIKISRPLPGASKCKQEKTFYTRCYSSQQFLKERQQEPTCPPSNSKERGKEECIIFQEATNFLKVEWTNAISNITPWENKLSFDQQIWK